MGVDKRTLTDDAIQSLAFLQFAELMISRVVNDMAAAVAGVPTATQIMNTPSPLPPAAATDVIALKAAVVYYIGWMFTPSEPNAVNTSVTLGEQTVDLGGIGTQWIQQGERNIDMTRQALQLITAWPKSRPTVMILGGPTSQGYDNDTVSGWGSILTLPIRNSVVIAA